jgi:Putative stress-induced transcription regulator
MLVDIVTGTTGQGDIPNAQEPALHITNTGGKACEGTEGFEEFMALIEIPNSYNAAGPADTAGRGRFALIGEPVVAVDLINTVTAPGSPAGYDLLSADHGAETWWRLQRARLPRGDLPDIRALRRLRSALREMIEALIDDRPVPKAAVSEVNFFTQSVPASRRLLLTGRGWAWRRTGTRSSAEICGWRSSPPRQRSSFPTRRRSPGCAGARTQPV